LGDKIEKNWMGGACSTLWGEARCIGGFGRGNLRERDNVQDSRMDGMIILKWIFQRLGCGVIDWIDLA